MSESVPTKPIGYVNQSYGSGTNTWWMYDEESTPELRWPQSISVYDAMRTQDAQVGSVLEAVVRPILRTTWRLDPAGASPEVVEFVADDLGLPIVGEDPDPPPRTKDRFSWLEHLELALLMLPFGYSYFEQIYRVDDDGARAHLGKLELRPAKTIDKIDVARDGGLISITQCGTLDYGMQRSIPVNRLVAYIYKKEGANWLGRSILRQAYKNWLIKDRLLRVQAQTIERNGMGIPLYEGAEGEVALTAGLAMARAWRSGESAGTAIPNGAKLSLVGVSGTLPDSQPAIDYHDNQIARAVLAHFLNLGQQSGTGSYALGVTFADFFTASLQTLAQQVADVATQHIVEDLVDINWGRNEPAPKITFDEIGSRQQATAQSIVALMGAGALTPDERLEQTLRQQYGLPPKQDQFLVDQPDGPAAPVDVAAVEVQASAHIDDGDDDEPGQFDEDTAALIAALADFAGEVWAEAGPDFDELHPRGPGGRFRSTFARIQRALTDWGNGDGPNDPLSEFKDREPLRQAAGKRGVKLRRGATRDEIASALLDDVREKRSAARGRRADAQSGPVRMTLASPAFRDLDVGVYREKNGKVSLYRLSPTSQRRGAKVVSVDSLEALQQWGEDNGEPQVSSWAASERGAPVKKVAPRKAAPKKAITPATSDDGSSWSTRDQRRQQVAKAAATPVTDTVGLGGFMGGTSRETHADGTVLMHKRLGDDKNGGRTGVEQADAEELGSQVAAALGLHAPAVHRVGPDELQIEFVPGTHIEHDPLAPWALPPADIIDSDQGRLFGLLDMLMGNPDRHAGNWMLTDDGIAPVDNALAFGRHGSSGLRSPFTPYLANAAGNDWAEKVDLSPADVATVRERLTGLRGEFERLDRLDWWQTMMDNLSIVEPRASGIKRRIDATPTPAKKAAVPASEREPEWPPPWLRPEAIADAKQKRQEQREALGIAGEPTEEDARTALSRLSAAQIKKAYALTNTEYVLKGRASRRKLGDKQGKAFGTTATEEQLRDELIAEVVGQARRRDGDDSGPQRAHAELVDLALEIKPAKVIPKVALAPSSDLTTDLGTLRAMPTEARRDALDERKLPELKAMLKAEGLPVSGRKRELVDRLVERLEGDAPNPDAPDVEPPAETAARTRQATVDRARSVSGLLRDVDEFLTNGASDKALEARIRSRSEVAGTPPELRDALLTPLREVEVENAIRAAYRQIVDDGGGGFGGFVGIADLRDAVGDGISREELDASLKRMARGNSPAVQSDGFRLIPIANQKALTDRDREAAIRQGGENLNAVSFADPSAREPDHTRLRQLLDTAASDAGLRPIEAAGTRTTFDPARHEALDGKIPAGTPVRVTRQGYVTDVDGDEVVLDRAVVMRDEQDTSRSTIPDADDDGR